MADRGRGRPGSGSGRRRRPQDRPRSGARNRPAGGRGLGGDQVEGRQAVRELLLAGTRQVREVLVADDLDRSDIVGDIIDLASELNVAIKPVGRKRLAAEAATGSHQGVMARAAALPSRSLDELLAPADPFLLVLDGVTDPGNLGAVLRTAECSGVTGIVLPRHRSVHITPTVTKAAAGAVEHLPMAIVGGVPAAVAQLTEAGVTTIGLDGAGSTSIHDLADTISLDGPVALVLGSEGSGLLRLTRQRVDMLVAIPLLGRLNSLNVAAAAAIACFEIVRGRTKSFPRS